MGIRRSEQLGFRTVWFNSEKRNKKNGEPGPKQK